MQLRQATLGDDKEAQAAWALRLHHGFSAFSGSETNVQLPSLFAGGVHAGSEAIARLRLGIRLGIGTFLAARTCPAMLDYRSRHFGERRPGPEWSTLRLARKGTPTRVCPGSP